MGVSSDKPPSSSKAPNQDSKDIEVLCTLKIQIKTQIVILVYQRPVIISISKSRCKTPIRNLKHPQKSQSGHNGLGCSLHLHHQDRELKFGTWVYQRTETISISKSRSKTPVKNLRHPSKPKSWLKLHLCLQNFQNHFRQLELRALVYERLVAMIWNIKEF